MSIFFDEIYPDFDYHHNLQHGAEFRLKVQIDDKPPITVAYRMESASEERVIANCLSPFFEVNTIMTSVMIDDIEQYPSPMGLWIVENAEFYQRGLTYGTFDKVEYPEIDKDNEDANRYGVEDGAYIAIAYNEQLLKLIIGGRTRPYPPFSTDTEEDVIIWRDHLLGLAIDEFNYNVGSLAEMEIKEEKHVIKFLKADPSDLYYDVFDMLYIPVKEYIDEKKHNVERAIFNENEIIFTSLFQKQVEEGSVPVGG